MKILVLSDSHGDFDSAYYICEKVKPDYIIHLGDGCKDAEKLGYIYDIPIENVAGNCDYGSSLPYSKIIEVAEKRLFICHGHTLGVKSGLGAAIKEAEKNNCSVLLYGHTHKAYCKKIENLWIMNPGSCHNLCNYGIVSIEKGEIVCYNTPNL